jgi:exosortase/archaeosortase family protein
MCPWLVPAILLVPTWPWWVARVHNDTFVSLSFAALVACAVFLVHQVKTKPTSHHPAPSWLLVVPVVLALLHLRMPVPTLAAAMALSSLGLLLCMRFLQLRQHAFAWWMMMMIALPTRASMDVWLGWPLRKLAAGIAAKLLGGTTTATLLLLEGQNVDVTEQCAGIASLHLMLLVVCGWCAWHRASWQRTIVALLLATCALVVGNCGRIVVLAVLRMFPSIAAVVHEPMGLLAFLSALGAAMSVPIRSVVASPPTHTQGAQGDVEALWRGRASQVVLVLTLVITAASYAQQADRHHHPDESIEIERAGTAVGAVDVPLSPAELALFRTAHVVRGRLADGNEILLVESTDPRHFHEAERCMTSAGHTVRGISDGEHHTVHFDDFDVTSVFIHGTRSTASTAEVWSDLLMHPDHRWVNITVLTHHDAPATAQTANHIIQAATAALIEGQP